MKPVRRSHALIAAVALSTVSATALAGAGLGTTKTDEIHSGGYSSSSFNPYQTKPGDYFSSLVRHPVPLKDELTFESLKVLIQKKRLKTIEAVIEALPDYMKNDNYVLMYHSRSLQSASPEAPRAILYTPTASLALSFNGGPESGSAGRNGGNTIELIQFRRDTQKFEFREIEFDGKSLPKFSVANPAKCLTCHQSPLRKETDMRPNWEPYATWIGAFGSDDAHLEGTPLRGSTRFKEKLRPQDEEVLKIQPNEKALLMKFLNELAPKHARYSKLGRFNLHAPVDLTQHLGLWNAMRVMRLIAQEKEIYETYRDAIAYSITCWAESDLLKMPLMQWHEKESVPPYFHYTSKEHLSYLFTQVFESYGVDTSDWSMDFGTRGRMAAFERLGTPSNTFSVFSYALEYTPPANAPKSRNCDELRARYEQTFTEFYLRGEHLELQARLKKANPRTLPTGKDIAQRCARCHVEGSGQIPKIPFDRPELVTQGLSRDGGPLMGEIERRTSDMATHGEQMPPNQRLSPHEREVLLDYLKGTKNLNQPY